jgi:hypothetical protein
VKKSVPPTGAARLLFDLRPLRARCLAGLTRASDRWLRSGLFLTSMRLGLRTLTGMHSRQNTGERLRGDSARSR